MSLNIFIKSEDKDCMEKCIGKKIDGSRPENYNLFIYNCWHWARDSYSECANSCNTLNFYNSVSYEPYSVDIPKLPIVVPHSQKYKY